MKNFLKPWEVVLVVVLMFLICSTSLYWYDRFNKTRRHSIEMEMKSKWEQDTLKWQKDATDKINSIVGSQKQIVDILNTNIAVGRLIIPQKEKK